MVFGDNAFGTPLYFSIGRGLISYTLCFEFHRRQSVPSSSIMEPVEFVPAPDIADTPADYHPPYQRPEDVAREFLTIPMSKLPYRADLRTNLPFTEIASPFQYFRLLLADAALNLIVLNTNAY